VEQMPFSVGQRRVRGSYPGDRGARSAGVPARSIPRESCVAVRRAAREGGARAEERVPAFLNLWGASERSARRWDAPGRSDPG
jgi:hypothetical protein